MAGKIADYPEFNNEESKLGNLNVNVPNQIKD